MSMLFCLMMAGSDLDGRPPQDLSKQIKGIHQTFVQELRPKVLTLLFAGKTDNQIATIKDSYAKARLAPPITDLKKSIQEITAMVRQITAWVKARKTQLSEAQIKAATKSAQEFNQEIIKRSPEGLKAEEARKQEEECKRKEVEDAKLKAEQDGARKRRQAEQERKLKEEADRLEVERKQKEAERQKPPPKKAAVAAPSPNRQRPDVLQLASVIGGTIEGEGDGTVNVYRDICGIEKPTTPSPEDFDLLPPASPKAVTPTTSPDGQARHRLAKLFQRRGSAPDLREAKANP